jgi:hypothetical protein
LLGGSDGHPERLFDDLAQLQRRLQTLVPPSSIKIANAIWVDLGVQLKSEFTQKVKESFGGEVFVSLTNNRATLEKPMTTPEKLKAVALNFHRAVHSGVSIPKHAMWVCVSRFGVVWNALLVLVIPHFVFWGDTRQHAWSCAVLQRIREASKIMRRLQLPIAQETSLSPVVGDSACRRVVNRGKLPWSLGQTAAKGLLCFLT